MYGWFYNSFTRTLNRYIEENFMLLTIQFDPESDCFVLFENEKDDLNFLKHMEKKDGWLKLIVFAEIFLSKKYPDHNKLGAFYLDQESLLEDKNGYFKVD